MTTTFVVEAMAAANAQLHWKRMENHQEDDGDSSTASDSDSLLQDSHERAEKRPILSVQRRGSPNLFEITDRVEMGQMASMFFNKGRHSRYLVTAVSCAVHPRLSVCLPGGQQRAPEAHAQGCCLGFHWKVFCLAIRIPVCRGGVSAGSFLSQMWLY
ncbi:transmembrane protein 104 isoform X2 [Pteropus vampyrus]|uniref:Transmembrane protein 104 isoform X2 n=1 Tax=Pteropus vampyrus TaxID=132908 RepID=A0A6P6CKB0_PTEVA|nr:transmembrane protein 104 isoform X2 [Pteropus vampyrus]